MESVRTATRIASEVPVQFRAVNRRAAGVAEALGVTTGTVKTLLFRARRHLHQRLEVEDSVQEIRQ